VPLDDSMARRLKLGELRVFQAVVERGGMAKAAARLNMSQSAISKAIATLESTLGVRLLDRTAKGVETTMYGRALLDGTAAVFDELNQSLKRIAFLTEPATGELRIGCTEFGAPGFAAAAIERFSEQCPRVNFRVVTADLATLLDRHVRERNIELATAGGAADIAGSDFDVEVLFEDRHQIMAGTRSKWTRRRNIAIEDLLEEPWILPPTDSPDGKAVAKAFRLCGLEPPQARIVTHSIALCHRLLATGRFLAMQPVVMARLARHLPIAALDVEFVGFSRSVELVTLKGRTLSPLAELFIECARDLAKTLPRTSLCRAVEKLAR
jgi:DNA-binding transcriptional LysR family regulator